MKRSVPFLVPCLAIGGLTACVAAGPVVDSYAIHLGEIVAGHTTYEIRLNAVGLGGLMSLGHTTGNVVLEYSGAQLWNANNAPAGQNDFNTGASAVGDSWLALGGYDAGANTPQWTPGIQAYLDAQPAGERFLVKGTQWGGFENEGNFVIPSFLEDDGSGLLVAQFTVEGTYSIDDEIPFMFVGTAFFDAPGGPDGYTFKVTTVIPVPGALAIFAGMMVPRGRRRR